MKSAVALLVLVAVASATHNVPTSDKHIAPFSSDVQSGNLFQVTQHVEEQFHHAQQLGYNGQQIAQFLLKQGYPKKVVNYLVQQYEAGLDQPYVQSPQFYYQQQGQGVSHFNVQYSHVQLQKVLQYVQSALKYFVNGQVSNQYFVQQLQQVVQHIQQIQQVSGVYTQSQVAVVYQILNNLHHFVMQQGEQLPQFVVQQVELAYQIFNHQESQVASSMYYQQLIQLIKHVQQYLHSQTVASPQLSYISLQLNQAYQIYYNVSLMSQKAHFIQPLNVIVESQLHKAYQYLNTAYLLAQQQGLAVIEQLQQALAVAQQLQSNGSSQFHSQVGVSQSHVGVSQAHHYAEELVHYVEQQVSQGVISQVHASYILQQLQQIQYGVSQAQVHQYFQNVYQYVQQQVDISPVVVEHITHQIELVFQSLNGQFQGQNYVQSLVHKYFNGAHQQGQFNTPYQFNGVEQGHLSYPYQYHGVPHQFSDVEQGQVYTPYQYSGVHTPYQSHFGFNQAQQSYTPYHSYQSHGIPLAYQPHYNQLTAVAY